jgi:hypothetical protein
LSLCVEWLTSTLSAGIIVSLYSLRNYRSNQGPTPMRAESSRF